MSGRFDSRAYAVAQAVHSRLTGLMALDNTVLFGSRARGEHSDDSDIALLLLVPDRQDMAVRHFSQFRHAATQAGKQAIRQRYAHPWEGRLDLVFCRVSDFQFYRPAPNHVAYGVLQEGVPVNQTHWHSLCNQEPLRDPSAPCNDHWPVIRLRCKVAYRHLGTTYTLLHGPFPSREDAGFHARQAVENALQGWIAALGQRVRKTHALSELIQTVGDALSEMHDPVTGQATLTWLTEYAVTYRYGEAIAVWGEPDLVYRQTLRLVDQIVQEISACLDYDVVRNAEIAPQYNALRTTLSDPSHTQDD